jgi:hypothetical protein
MSASDAQGETKPEDTNVKLAIGEYIYYFQSMCHQMQSLILLILKKSGLTRDDIGRIIVGDLGADRLQTISRHMFKSFVVANDMETNIIDKCFSFVRNTIQERNVMVHSTWFIRSDTGDEVGFSYKIHKDGEEELLQYDKRKLNKSKEKCILARSFLTILYWHLEFDQTSNNSIVLLNLEIVDGELRIKEPVIHSD